MSASLWTADWVFAGAAPKRRFGLIITDGVVRELAPLDDLQSRYPRLPLENKGFYLGPPLVNAHTHLDLGLLPTFRGGFAEFLGYVIAHANERGLEAARKALPELGQRVVGSIATNDEKLVDWLLSESGLEGVVYWEVLGLLPPAEARDLLGRTARLVRRWKRLERPGGMRLGLSPHATYSLSPELMRGVVELALQEGLPLQIHVAESPAEVQYFADRSGPIADFFSSRGLPVDLHPQGLSPITYLAELGVLEAAPTLVHGVLVDEQDVALIAASGSRVVSCPRSNTNLNVGLPPYGLYQKHGVTPALGTDSHASAESLDVRDEIRYLLDHGVGEAAALEMSLFGYAALAQKPPLLTHNTSLRQVEFW